jgi:hypothetical protein
VKKKNCIVLCLLLAAAAQAAVQVDNFEEYATGPTASPWVVTDGSPVIGREAGGNQYIESFGSYRHLAGLAISDSDTETTVFFRLYKPAGTSPDCSVGLSNLADPQGDWNDYEAYVVVVSGNLLARNGNGNTSILSPMSEAVWYNIWMVINNNANTYDVYVTTGSSNAAAGDRKADNFVFRKSTAGALATFKIYGRSTGGPVWVDDIYISGGTDLTIPSQTSSPPVLLSHPADAAVNEDQDAAFQVCFTSRTAPSADWYKVASPADQLMDPAQPGIDVQVTYDAQTEEYTSTLTLTGLKVADGGLYYCRVSNESGFPRNTNAARLTVYGLAAHWTLDADSFGGGVYRDEAGGYDALVTGVPVFVTGAEGSASRAVRITADSGWALCPTLNPAGPGGEMTVSFWVNWNEAGAPQDLLAESTGEERLVQTGGLSADGRWRHVCAVFDGTTGKLYVNGLLQDQAAWLTPADTAANINIGCDSAGGNIFNGDMDDMRIYNYALTPAQIADIYFAMTGRSVCILDYAAPYDLSGPENLPDCIVDLYDLAAVAARWLCPYDLEYFSGFAGNWRSSGLYP